MKNQHFNFPQNVILKFAFFLFIGLQYSLAQQKITGTITDLNGPLPGASIIVKGTSTGVQADFDGKYSISANQEDTLIISYIGYVNQEVVISNQTTINVLLEENVSKLEEVVVVGYGSKKKVNLTGSVSVLDSEALQNRPSPNTASLLQGQMAGVQLTTPGGQPGNDQPIIRIRGAVSIGSDANNTDKNNPLVVIDGVQASLADLGRINSNEIENISVLKDAASASIYGTRAAGGVILVTTKQGKTGKVSINLDIYSGFQEAVVLPEFVDSWDYAILKNEARRNSGRADYFTEETIANLRAGTNPDLYPNVKWFDELFSVASINKYDLSISGGTEKVSYSFSGGYLNQDGILLNQGAKRLNYRSNIRVKLSDRITTGLNLWGYRNIADRSYYSTDHILRRAYFSQPLVPVRWTTGEAEGEFAGYTTLGTGNPKAVQNPIQRAANGNNRAINDKFSAQINTGIDLAKGLKYNSLLAYSVNNRNIEAYRPISLLTRFSGAQAPQSITETQLDRNELSQDQYQIDNILTYDNTLGSHTIGLLLGHSFTSFESDFFSASGTNLPNDLQILDVAVDNLQIGGYKSDWSLLSYFARFNYDYKSRYLFEANLRRDASSRFPDTNKWATFPSFSMGWRLSEEAFMDNVDFISQFKIRAGWGLVGNDQISNYPHNQAINLEQFYVDSSGNLLTGAGITELSNPFLKWEETTSKNLGLDLSLFKNKLEFTVEYFQNDSDGILTQLPLPLIFGNIQEPFQNAAAVRNSGWEFLANHRNQLGKFSYSISTNLSTLENEVIDFSSQESINGLTIVKEGEAINSFFGLKAEGIFQTDEEVANHAFQSNSTAAGDLKYSDVDGNGVIDEDDRVVIGKPLPGISYGFTIAAKYNGFDFSAFFQGVTDSEFYSQGFGNDGVANPRANVITDWLDRWTPENPSTEMPRVVWEDQNNRQNNSYWIRDGSYLRLKNIQLGYTLDTDVLDQVGMKSLRFYVSGQNLLTWTKEDNWDPEQLPSVTNATQHPQTKVFAFGINAKF